MKSFYKKPKTIHKACRFNEFKTLLSRCGWIEIIKRVVILFGIPRMLLDFLFKTKTEWQKAIKLNSFLLNMRKESNYVSSI